MWKIVSGRYNSKYRLKELIDNHNTISVADPDPGSGTFLTPGSGIVFFPDPGSDHYFWELKANFFLG